MTTAQTCVNTVHATLSTTTADSVVFTGQGSTILVTNRDTTNTLYFTIDGTTTASAAVKESFAVLPLQSKGLTIHGRVKLSVVGSGGGYSAELF